MFEKLSEKLTLVFKGLRGQGKISERNIEEGVRQVKLALLEADVSYGVVKNLLEEIRGRALGQEVLASLSPDQHFIKIVHESLLKAFSQNDNTMHLPPIGPGIIMMVGLQGSGKTTTASKLARYFLTKGNTCLLVAADTYRPAAINQLIALGNSINVPVFTKNTGAVDICREAIEEARKNAISVVIVDTAGRLEMDDSMMQELESIKSAIFPHEILYVLDCMSGQSALDVAKEFNRRVPLTGVIVTKMDGDSRGGAILSLKHVTGLSIKFTGVGEKIDALEPFFPDRIASRILGMGDILTLIEKAEQVADVKEMEETANRLLKRQFTLEDLRSQIKQIKKMGPMESIVKLLPGMGDIGNLPDGALDGKRIFSTLAILDSMTREERLHPEIINGSRRKRISKGSGTTITDINRLLKDFAMMRKVLSRAKGIRGLKQQLSSLFSGRNSHY